jgi:hypothetical protein
MKSPAGKRIGPNWGMMPSPLQSVSEAHPFHDMNPYTKRAIAITDGRSISIAVRRSRLTGLRALSAAA